MQGYSFSSSSDFTFVQEDQNRGPCQARTTGEIHIRPGPERSDSKIWVEVETYVSDCSLSCSHHGTPGDNSLLFESVINCPAKGGFGWNSMPVLYIYPTIYVAPDVTLDNLKITTDSLSVHFHPGLNLTVKKSTTVSAKGGGSVSMPSETNHQSTTFYSRETIIDLASGSVTGTYALYDLLSIHTTSGHIRISITPKPASASAVKPATLRLSTASGSINAHTPSLSSIPNRNYLTEIQSSSGSIAVSLLHGTHTSLRTSSGSLEASLYPYGPNTTRSDIETNTYSGRTLITVHPALVNATDPLRRLYGTYNYLSGSFGLNYPSSWEGTVEGVVTSGSVDIDWKGMRVVEDRRGWFGRRVKAVKGKGDGVLKFHGVSGSARLRGGSW